MNVQLNLIRRAVLQSKNETASFIKQLKAEHHKIASDVNIHNLIRGIGHLYDNRLNKGLAFTMEERQKLGIHGMLPPKIRTQKEQVELIHETQSKIEENTFKFLFLQELKSQNERLYYHYLMEHLEELFPVIYTPTYKITSTYINLIYRRPYGIYLTHHDLGHCLDVLRNWPEPVKAICVTDGSNILGFGDLGVYGMAVPIVKLTMYTAVARIKPYMCLPVMIDVGTNNEILLGKRSYIGLHQKRVAQEIEDALIDDFVKASIARFGTKTIIQFEDFTTELSFKLMDKYNHQYPVFNADIQAAGSVVMAGILSAIKITKVKLQDNKILFVGGGQPSIGTAFLCVKHMTEEGLTKEQALERIWMFDKTGLLVKGRELTRYSRQYAKDHAPIEDLHETIKAIKPTILIGLSKTERIFTPGILQDMAKFNERPVVFAMGNPCSKPECTPQEAYDNTNGKCVYASTQPFPPITWNGKTYEIRHSNNAMIFPGLVNGAILCGLKNFTDDIFLTASKVISDLVPENELAEGKLYPPFKSVSSCAEKIAETVMAYAHKTDLDTIPAIADILGHIRKNQYSYWYEDEPSLPATYGWKNLAELQKAKHSSEPSDLKDPITYP